MDEKKFTLRFELLHRMNHKGHDTKRLGIEGTPSPRKEISLSLLFLSHSYLQSLLHQESELSLEFTHFSARKANYCWIHIFAKATHLIEPILLGNVCLIPSPLCAWIQWQPNSNNVVQGWKAFLRVVGKPAQVVVLKEFYKGSPIWVLYVQFVAFLS